MTTATKQSTKKAWAKAIAQPGAEFPLTPLPLLSGKIPPGLRGTLYRNGPARLERGGVRVGHWFDGDGAILAVHFNLPYQREITPPAPPCQGGEMNTNPPTYQGGEITPPAPPCQGGERGGATGVYRYVQTAEYQAETEAGRFLYGVYGMNPPGPIWKRWNPQMKNAANTSVLALPDKILALWEATKPYALDLQTLETLRLDDLGGLEKGLPYAAHYKRDPRTGEIFNFGVSIGRQVKLNLYRSDSTGKILQKAAVTLDSFSVVHDFVLTDQYLVFFIPPVRLKPLPLLTGLSTFCDALVWEPKLGTQVLVLDRNTLSVVSRGETDPWFHWHFGNGYVDADGSVILDLVRFADFQQTNQYLKEVATGQTHTRAKGTLWRSRINPQTGKIISMDQVLDRGCEFPVVSPSEVGQFWRYTKTNRECGSPVSLERGGNTTRGF